MVCAAYGPRVIEDLGFSWSVEGPEFCIGFFCTESKVVLTDGEGGGLCRDR